MDVSNTGSVRYNVTWQAMGDPLVEVEINCSETVDEDELLEAVSNILKLAVTLGARVIVTSEDSPTKQFCLEILFANDENKRFFLGKLPTVQ